MLRSLGVPVKGATALCGNSLGVIIYCTNPDSELKNNHVAISYHKLRQCAESGIVNPIKFCTMLNRAEIFTKLCCWLRLVVCTTHHMEWTGERAKLTRPGSLAAGYYLDYIILLLDVLVYGAVNTLAYTCTWDN